MVGFIRFGNDFTQILPNRNSFSDLPSASSTSDCSPLSAQEVWPEENEIDLSLALLTQLKIMAMSVDLSTRLRWDYKNEDELKCF
jgi:hypothetical protein